jgi:hypothetical protein
MASITQCNNRDGSKSYRVTLKKLDHQTFSLCFNSYEEAFEWARINEPEYREKPKSFCLKYSQALRTKMAVERASTRTSTQLKT